MAERKGHAPNPYQLPFEWRGSSRNMGQHVRELHEPRYVRSSLDAVDYFLTQVYVPFEAFRQEQLYVLLLDQRKRITHDVMVYKGTVNAVQIRTAEIFMEAVRFNSPSILVGHNHPSGNPSVSPEDIAVTEIIYAAGKLLDIELLDHVVIGDNAYTSLRAQGLGFP